MTRKCSIAPTNSTSPAPIQVSFNIHPNQIIAGQPVQLQLSKAGKPLVQAEVLLRKQGATDQQAQSISVNANGSSTITFPQAGGYLIEVSEKLNPKAVPKNQYYTIISLGVNNSTS